MRRFLTHLRDRHPLMICAAFWAGSLGFFVLAWRV